VQCKTTKQSIPYKEFVLICIWRFTLKLYFTDNSLLFYCIIWVYHQTIAFKNWSILREDQCIIHCSSMYGIGKCLRTLIGGKLDLMSKGLCLFWVGLTKEFVVSQYHAIWINIIKVIVLYHLALKGLKHLGFSLLF